MKRMKSLASGVLVASLALGTAGPALAMSPSSVTPSSPSISSNIMTEADFSAELDLIFNHFFEDRNGTLYVNERAVIEAGRNVSTYTQMAKDLNSLSREANYQLGAVKGDPESLDPMHRIGSKEWGRCVLNLAGFGGFLGATYGGKNLMYLLAAQNWREAAWVIFRLTGGAMIRGGVAGLAASLAAGAGWCSTPWAASTPTDGRYNVGGVEIDIEFKERHEFTPAA